ncbi:hypothetical protein QUB80_16405 [Chlorogloeopsis sp. ULAP01]|uniref:hypothetical protein n=1 Tax=Chlorogloeopsis sp. ULAP01 TaxID=3056483 RepID=UPI0025AA9122|nr:hypothetical protein [Chlorogloeopsis sp. ULAP01]MDM9382288.1 hypothetical protein [Chlorogloeopsis sp. ULAP01]
MNSNDFMMSAITIVTPLVALLLVDAQQMTSPSREEVCAVVTAMSNGQTTNSFLKKIGVERQQVIHDLGQLKINKPYKENISWQYAIEKSNAIADTQLHTSIMGALHMACE